MIERLYNNVFLRLYNAQPAFFAIFLVASGYLVFNISDAFTKYFADIYPAYTIIFWISLFSLLTMLLVAWASGFKKTITSTAWHWHIARGLLALGGFYLIVLAVKNTTLANFYAIVFLSPMTCVIAARIFFGDALSIQKMCAILVAFFGILVVVQPGVEPIHIGIWASLGCVFLHTGSIMLVRKMGAHEPKLLFGLSYSFIVAMGALIINLSIGDLIIPEIDDLKIMASLGIACAIAGTAVSTGFQIAPSTSTVAPFHYIQIIGGIVIGYIYWGDVPTTTTLVGASIVIAAGLWLLNQEKGHKSHVASDLKDVIEDTSDIKIKEIT